MNDLSSTILQLAMSDDLILVHPAKRTNLSRLSPLFPGKSRSICAIRHCGMVQLWRPKHIDFALHRIGNMRHRPMAVRYRRSLALSALLAAAVCLSQHSPAAPPSTAPVVGLA